MKQYGSRGCMSQNLIQNSCENYRVFQEWNNTHNCQISTMCAHYQILFHCSSNLMFAVNMPSHRSNVHGTWTTNERKHLHWYTAVRINITFVLSSVDSIYIKHWYTAVNINVTLCVIFSGQHIHVYIKHPLALICVTCILSSVDSILIDIRYSISYIMCAIFSR